MVTKKGIMKYIPPVIVDELIDIKREDEVEEDVLAFKKMVEYTRVGREVKRMLTLDFSRKRVLPAITSYPISKPKKKLRGGES